MYSTSCVSVVARALCFAVASSQGLKSRVLLTLTTKQWTTHMIALIFRNGILVREVSTADEHIELLTVASKVNRDWPLGYIVE